MAHQSIQDIRAREAAHREQRKARQRTHAQQAVAVRDEPQLRLALVLAPGSDRRLAYKGLVELADSFPKLRHHDVLQLACMLGSVSLGEQPSSTCFAVLRQLAPFGWRRP